MISGGCPHCDTSWSWGWDEEQYGFMCAKCAKCRKVFWIEFARIGVTRDHEAFLKEIAEPDGRVAEANEAYATGGHDFAKDYEEEESEEE